MYISATIIFFKVMRVRTSSTIPCIGIRFAEFSGAAVIQSAKKGRARSAAQVQGGNAQDGCCEGAPTPFALQTM